MAGPSLGNRAAREDELAAISALEQSGEKQFRAAGMDRIAGAPAPGPDVYRPALDDGRLLVAVDPRDRPVGFIRLEMLDGDPHIEQVSVHPDHGGHGIGASLLAAAEQLSRYRGHRRITLTTFRDVPWNGPYYRRLGWRAVPEADLPPELAAARRQEGDLGFDEWPRQAMAKVLQRSWCLRARPLLADWRYASTPAPHRDRRPRPADPRQVLDAGAWLEGLV
jgi:GNAT superfamily N-acetyltransferase